MGLGGRCLRERGELFPERAGHGFTTLLQTPAHDVPGMGGMSALVFGDRQQHFARG
jgi:hypothetical protein